jgi:hypothetical protein
VFCITACYFDLSIYSSNFLVSSPYPGVCPLTEFPYFCQVSKLPPEVLAYFSNPDIDVGNPPELEQLTPFVEAALPLAYGVFGVQVFHVSIPCVLFWLIISTSRAMPNIKAARFF